MRKTAILALIFMFSFPVAQDIEYENLMNTKWKLKNYIIDGQSFPIEKKRKKDYYIFKKNNQKEEVLYGKKSERFMGISSSWEIHNVVR